MFYVPSEGQALRMAVKHTLAARDGGERCYYCHQPLPLKMLTIDHYVPRFSGGQNHTDNFVLACRGCNAAKGCLDLRLNSDREAFTIIMKRRLAGMVMAKVITEPIEGAHSWFVLSLS